MLHLINANCINYLLSYLKYTLRHEINANSQKRTFLVTLINANFKHIIFSDHPFSLKHAEYQTENTAVIE